MFIGHYAVGLAAKRLAPQTSLGTLFAAVQLIDLLWPIFLLLGLEHVRIDPGNTAFTPLDFYDYPITHSLVGCAAWAVGFALTYYALRRDGRGAAVVGAGVFSHWLLDFITHRPDLPILPSGPKVGLGLWSSVLASAGLELALFVAGAVLYQRGTRANDRIGRYGLTLLLALLLLLWVANIFGPPPPSVTALASSALLLWLFVPWAAWVDRHRTPTSVKIEVDSRS